MVIHLIFSYNYFNGWWYSSIGTLLIIIISYFIWKNNFIQFIGLKINKKKIILSVLLTILLLGFSYLFISFIGLKNNIGLKFSHPLSYYHIIFYTFNEEIIFGAILLNLLLKNTKINPIIISALLSIGFTLMHFIFYKWVFLDRGILQPITLTTLFLFFFFRNNLIIKSSHIGYSWALHFSWMAIMFGCQLYYSNSGNGLSELHRFNTFIGSYEMLIVSFILATFSAIYYRKNMHN